MSDCYLMRESMPMLLTESLDPVRRENAHQHIEQCAACSEEWAGYRETWNLLETLPELEVPPRVKQQFMTYVDPPAQAPNVVPFQRRPAVRWLAQAAAVVIIAGGAYVAGHRTQTSAVPVVDKSTTTPATVTSAMPLSQSQIQPAAFSIAESRVLPANSISPVIEGRPDIQNVSFSTLNGVNDEISVGFDITSHVTVQGRPTDKTMIRLMRYALENEDRMAPTQSRAIDWVRSTYSQPGNADPEITRALANVLRNDTHEGVRIKAVDTLTKLPAAAATNDSREALIQALKSDPNPAVRIKAVEALANLLKKGGTVDAITLETLRAKASQDDENMYVRVKAAEALSNVRP
ncbi:MAG TPA: HEAT repeat domain-containing protein [Thermoanaerobaculia bacterium]|nr:HEAT repeat domain-containing protein [Thermoanaerobaculia bacterium]